MTPAMFEPSSLLALFTAAAHTLDLAPVDERRMFSAADAFSIAADVREAIPDPAWDLELEYAIEQAWDEGRWQASPRGSLPFDCGVVQMNKSIIPAGFGTCTDLRASRVLAIRAWHVVVAAAIERCGSVRSGLGAVMSTGKCGSVPQLVAYRCGRSRAC